MKDSPDRKVGAFAMGDRVFLSYEGEKVSYPLSRMGLRVVLWVLSYDFCLMSYEAP